MICVEIDALTPCLTNLDTGDIVETEVLKVSRKSFLSKFNKRTGWYTNWALLAKENEIYALVLKGTVDIQGLIAVKPNPEMKCLFISWAVAAPQNNKEFVNKKRFDGVGGHLLAIAAERSCQQGFEGEMTGFAMNQKLVIHYCEELEARHITALHPFQVVFTKNASTKLMEGYTYEWSEDEL